MADHLNSPPCLPCLPAGRRQAGIWGVGGLGGWEVKNSFGVKKQVTKIIFFAVSKILFTFALTNQIFLPFLECLVFIKKGEEIRLCETLATNPEIRKTVPKPNPGKPGDDKN